VNKGFLLESQKERQQIGISRSRWEDNIKMELREIEWDIMTGLIWLRIGTIGGLLRTR
jgi:hypothetical protein